MIDIILYLENLAYADPHTYIVRNMTGRFQKEAAVAGRE